MALIKNQTLAIEDSFRRIADDADIPNGDVLVPWERYVLEPKLLSERQGRVGVILPPDTAIAEVAPHVQRLALIAVDFPKYTDGRGYSLARRLRTQHAYDGELRAVGDILRDQLFFLKRCGFDAFELKSGKDAQGALEAFKEFSVTYQGSADDVRPLFRRDQSRS